MRDTVAEMKRLLLQLRLAHELLEKSLPQLDKGISKLEETLRKDEDETFARWLVN